MGAEERSAWGKAVVGEAGDVREGELSGRDVGEGRAAKGGMVEVTF